MKCTYYHATSMSNLCSIVEKGLLCKNVEKCVYLCEMPEDCLKFTAARGITNVLVCEVCIDESQVIETFDHSYDFFKCRCFASTKDIDPKQIKNYVQYGQGGIK